MPRPSEQGTVRSAGFGPDAAQNPQLQVVAPLDVEAAPTQAKMLAAALGHAADIAQAPMLRQARLKGAADEAQGEGDQVLGQVDPEKAARIAGYASGAHRASVESSTLDAINTLQQKAATDWQNLPLRDTTDANGQPVKGLMTTADDYLKQQLGGLDKDPVAAKVMAPLIQRAMEDIAGKKRERDVLDTQQEAEDAATGLLTHAIQGGVPFDMNAQRQKLIDVYGGNARAGTSALVHVVGEAAVNAGSPSTIDQFLPSTVNFGNGATLNPADRAYLDNAKARATEAQQRNNQAVVKQSQASIGDLLLSNKDPLPALHEYLKLPGADADFALHAYDWFYRRGKEHEEDALENSPVMFDGIAAIARGDMTHEGDVIPFLAANNITGGKAGNVIAGRLISEIRNQQNIEANDPDYRIGMSDIEGRYAPTRGPLGQIVNDAQRQQQVAAMSDYRTEYLSQVRQGKTTTDAALAAAKSVKEKYSTKVADDPRANHGAPAESDIDQVRAIKNAWKDRGAFFSSNVSPDDIQRLYHVGMIEKGERDLTLQMIHAMTKPK